MFNIVFKIFFFKLRKTYESTVFQNFFLSLKLTDYKFKQFRFRSAIDTRLNEFTTLINLLKVLFKNYILIYIYIYIQSKKTVIIKLYSFLSQMEVLG